MSGPPAFQVGGELPGGALVLEASAGTGKTYALTALAVRYVAETDLKLPELLLVTFTRMATAELSDRVRRRLADTLGAVERALEDPAAWAREAERGDADPVLDRVVGDVLDDRTRLEVRRERLLAATQDLDEATISTIHGFCQRMLQHAALEAAVDFDAVLLEDDTELLAEVVDDWIALELRTADPALIRYLQHGAGIGRSRLQGLAGRVAGLPSLRLRPAHPPPADGWPKAVAGLRDAWEATGPAEVAQLIERLKAEGGFAKPRQQTYVPKKVDEQAQLLDEWLADAGAYPEAPIAARTSDRNTATCHPVYYFSGSALGLWLADGTAPSLPLLDAADRVLEASAEPATAFLHGAAHYIWGELARRKRQRTLLTYDDLLRRLADALDDPGTATSVRAAIRQRYSAALIDEFQDTDPVQWRIFDAVFARDEPFVLIGDPKQAIYAFRGADVRTYVHARDDAGHVETLRTNHRSDRGHVEAVNHLFAQEGVFAEAGIDYHRISPHQPDRLHYPDGQRPAVRIRFARDEAGERYRGWLTKGWSDKALPGDVAATVVDLLESGARIDDGRGRSDDSGGRSDDGRARIGDSGGRPIDAPDIAVLVRTNRRALLMQQALRDARVPAVIQRGGSVYATDEAEWLQRLLDALTRPGDDRLAATAAASPLFGRDGPTLAAQREAVDDPGGSRATAAESELVGVWDDWLDQLHAWSARWQGEGVMAALREALADDGVPQRLLRQPGGDRSLTNVWHLAELLHTAEAGERLGPTALADWLRQRRADALDDSQPDADTELRLEEDAAAVRIVTVHGSKGLQYPVVLCPDLWDGSAKVDETLTRFHDPEAATPLDAITLDLDADRHHPRKQDSIGHARREERAEQLRLAYVALTRAQHACVVWWGRFADAPTSPLASLLHGEAVASAADRLERAEARVREASDTELLTELEARAAASEGTIAVEALSELSQPRPLREPQAAAPALAARSFTRGDIDRSWRRTSFTSLVRPAAHAHAGPGPREGRDTDDHAEGPGGGHAPRYPAGDAPPNGPAGDAQPNDPGGDAQPNGPAGDAQPNDPGGDASPDDPAADFQGLPDVPLAGFPAGPGPGVFLHDLLEHLDFADASTERIAAAASEQERRHGIDPEHRATVADGLAKALGTPLGPVGGGARLRDLPRDRRLDELRFELPLAGGASPRGEALALRAVADLLAGSSDRLVAAYADRLRDPALAGRVRGFLTGSIDLLAAPRHGRFFVADYKSNRLRDRDSGRCTAWHYRPAALAEEMLDHHYVLQALLYLVAAHRYLRWRLGSSYQYEAHMSGAAYLFLRGMTGAAEDPTTGGSPGVVALQPEGALVEELSALLDQPGGAK